MPEDSPAATEVYEVPCTSPSRSELGCTAIEALAVPIEHLTPMANGFKVPTKIPYDTALKDGKTAPDVRTEEDKN